jgi:hypothetical protein
VYRITGSAFIGNGHRMGSRAHALYLGQSKLRRVATIRRVVSHRRSVPPRRSSIPIVPS